MKEVRVIRGMSVIIFLAAASALVLSVVLIPASPVHAGTVVDEPNPDDMFNPVIVLLKDMAVSGIRFVVYLSGIIFILTVVIGAMKGSLGTAIGNQSQASQGVMTAIGAVASLILMLVSIPLANTIVSSLTERFVSEISMDVNAAELVGEGSGEYAEADLTHVLENQALQETISSFAVSIVKAAIGVGTIAFIIAVALGGLDTQLGSLFGGGMQTSRGIMRIISSVAAVIFLFISYPLATAILNNIVPRIVSGISIETPF